MEKFAYRVMRVIWYVFYTVDDWRLRHINKGSLTVVLYQYVALALSKQRVYLRRHFRKISRFRLHNNEPY